MDDNKELYIGKVYQINEKLDSYKLFCSFLLVIIARYWIYFSSFLKNQLIKLVQLTDDEKLLKEKDGEIRRLTSERNKYSIKDEFAQYMKIERKIVKLENEKKKILEKINNDKSSGIVENICLLIARTSFISYLIILAFPDVFFSSSIYKEDVTPISTIVFATVTILSLEYLVDGLKSHSYFKVENDKKLN